jgi:hypothetical protein
MSEITVQVEEENLTTVSTNTNNPIFLETLDNVGDIDASTKINGSILVYKTITNKWTSTTTLDAQNMEGGEF